MHMQFPTARYERANDESFFTKERRVCSEKGGFFHHSKEQI